MTIGLKLSTFCDASFGTRCFGGDKVKLTGSRSSYFLIDWASRPAKTSELPQQCFESTGLWMHVSLKPVSCDGHEDNDALRMAVSRGSSSKLASPCPRRHMFFGSASNFAAPSEHDKKCFFFWTQMEEKSNLSVTENLQPRRSTTQLTWCQSRSTSKSCGM